LGNLGEIAATAAGALAALALAVLPGAWITFGLPLRAASGWARLWTGCALSPLVVVLEYYALRLAGFPFEAVAVALVALNAPALWLIARHPARPRLPGAGAALLWVALHLIPIGLLLAPAWLQPLHRLYWVHSWVHTGTIYLIANGQLTPEESHLAGVALAYPFGAHVYQALVSYLLGSAPVASYLWTNVGALVVISGLVSAAVGDLGGGLRAKMAALVLLWFAVGALGLVLRQVLPPGLERRQSLWGDPRYTPWLWKFRWMEHVVFGLVAFAALPYWVLRAASRRGAVSEAVLVLLILCAVALLYPILYAPAFGLVAAGGAWLLAAKLRERRAEAAGPALALTAVLALSGVVALGFFRFLTAERAVGAGGFSGAGDTLRKLVELVVAPLPLSVCALWLLWRWRGALPRPARVLAAGALVSAGLYLVIELTAPKGEYKFMFTLGLCLAPLAGVALEPLLARAGRAWPVALFGATLVLALPFVQKLHRTWGTPREPLAQVDASAFELRLSPSEPLAGACEALRHGTSPDTVLVVDDPRLELTALTGRALYAPERHDEMAPGVMIRIADLLSYVRGYSGAVIQRRRDARDGLFHGSDAGRPAALQRVLELGRPAAILIDLERHRALADWLRRSSSGVELHRGGGWLVWLVRPNGLHVATHAR
jgi:hypothetical protein